MVALSVFAVFMIILFTDVYVHKNGREKRTGFVENHSVVDIGLFNGAGISIPYETYISKGHTYAEPIDGKTVKVGIDEFVSYSLGDFKIESIAAKGTVVKAGDFIMSAKVGNSVISFASPVNGRVKVVNDRLIGNTINDFYGNDWGALITSDGFDKPKQLHKTNEDLAEWMKTEMTRLKNYLFDSLNRELAGATMFDGGTINKGAVALLDDKAVKKFQMDFLSI